MLAARHRARLAMADENPDTREAKLRSVRRRLDFGSSNAQSLPTKQDIEAKFAQERAEHLEEKKAKWNFDFEEEKPLAGQWQWERIDKSSDKHRTSSSSSSSNGDAPENADASAQGFRGDAQEQAP